jgi:hypothetical protein
LIDIDDNAGDGHRAAVEVGLSAHHECGLGMMFIPSHPLAAADEEIDQESACIQHERF